MLPILLHRRRATYSFLCGIMTAARPAPAKAKAKALESHFKTDSASGRLRITEDAGSSDEEAADGAISSMGAYLEAMRGEDGHTRDSKGKAKFNKSQGKRGRVDMEDDGADVPVTEGLRELDVGGGRRVKKPKKEAVRIGGEFKAKVSHTTFDASRLWLTVLLLAASWWRCQEGQRRAVCVCATRVGGWQEGWSRAEAEHHRSQEEGGAQGVNGSFRVERLVRWIG